MKENFRINNSEICKTSHIFVESFKSKKKVFKKITNFMHFLIVDSINIHRGDIFNEIIKQLIVYV